MNFNEHYENLIRNFWIIHATTTESRKIESLARPQALRATTWPRPAIMSADQGLNVARVNWTLWRGVARPPASAQKPRALRLADRKNWIYDPDLFGPVFECAVRMSNFKEIVSEMVGESNGASLRPLEDHGRKVRARIESEFRNDALSVRRKNFSKRAQLFSYTDTTLELEAFELCQPGSAFFVFPALRAMLAGVIEEEYETSERPCAYLRWLRPWRVGKPVSLLHIHSDSFLSQHSQLLRTRGIPERETYYSTDWDELPVRISWPICSAFRPTAKDVLTYPPEYHRTFGHYNSGDGLVRMEVHSKKILFRPRLPERGLTGRILS